MSEALAKIEPKEVAASPFGANMVRNFDDLNKLGTMAVKSGMFKDIKDQAAACMKILAGLEMGIGPMASLRGLHVFNGKVEASAGLIAAKIKAHGKYNYRVTVSNAEKCEIQWFEGGEPSGVSSFTMDEARKAKLADKDVWKNFAVDMLFARALTRGQRKYAPDVFEGAIYAPGEISDAIEGEIVTEGDLAAPIIAEIRAIWFASGGTEPSWTAYFTKYLEGKSAEIVSRCLGEVKAKADAKRAQAEADTTPDDLLASIDRERSWLEAAEVTPARIGEEVAKINGGEVVEIHELDVEKLPALLDALVEMRTTLNSRKAKA